jgi:hypothetical protein
MELPLRLILQILDMEMRFLLCSTAGGRRGVVFKNGALIALDIMTLNRKCKLPLVHIAPPVRAKKVIAASSCFVIQGSQIIYLFTLLLPVQILGFSSLLLYFTL